MQRKFLYNLVSVCLFCSCQTNENVNQTSKNDAATNDIQTQKTDVKKEQHAFMNVSSDSKDVVNNSDFKTVAYKTVSPALSQKTYASARLTDTLTKSLREMYKNYFPVGTAVDVKNDLSNPQTVNLIKTQFASLSPKTALQPLRVHPNENTYNWNEGDMLVDFAQKNNLIVRGHCLIYDKHMPEWFYKDGNKPASKDLILQRIKDHVTAVVSHYKGKMYCWDVVNEAMRKDDRLYAICGEDYITTAFQAAHQADPSTKLFYNDGMYDANQRDKFYSLIKKWKSQGTPIDGIGLQYHLGIEGKSAGEIQKDIDAFSSLGLQVQITELDISIYPRMSTMQSISNVSDQLTPNVEDQQAAVYKTIFDVCRRNKGKVTGVTIWGVGDGQSFLEQKLNKKNYPYLFSNNLQPKKAFKDVTNF